MTQENKVPSPELLSLIKAAAQSLLGFGELWNSIKKKGHDEGFSEKELQDILRPLLKPQLNKNQIYYLFNTDEEKERSKKIRDAAVFEREIQPDAGKKDTEQSQDDALAQEEDFEKWKKEKDNVPVKDSTQFYKEQEPEEPTELELLKIENEQLKDALHKTEQFKPATALQAQEDDVSVVTVRAGIGAIENLMRLEIPKLKNRGWKTVEIKMRAV